MGEGGCGVIVPSKDSRLQYAFKPCGGKRVSSVEMKDMVIDDRERGIFRVHRSSMTSIDVQRREEEHIFNRCWIYVGHESEVEKEGDFRRRTVAGRPVFIVRGEDDQVRVFLNSCPHRGAVICRQDQGNIGVLQCFYHAWTYDINGKLIGVPGEASYGPYFDRNELGLKEPPRVESYRGFYFVSFDPYVVDLVTYLAGAKEYLDLVVDQSEEGMRVVRGSHKYGVKANWKVMAENGMDGYHIIPTHRTYLEYVASLGTDESGRTMMSPIPSMAKALGNGHCVVESEARGGRPVARWHPLFGEETKEPIAQARRRLVEKFGEERAYKIADTYRLLIIYPNLIVSDIMAAIVRQFEPAAPDRMEITAWHLVPKDDSGNMLGTRLDSFLTFFGPGGFATPDDVEAMESCQAGFRASGNQWSDISRGMLKPICDGADEIQMRGFWRQWHAHVQGLDQTNVHDGPATKREAAVALGTGD